MRALPKLIFRSLNRFLSSGGGIAVPALALRKEMRHRADEQHRQQITQPEASEQTEEGAFALPALEFGWGALGWRPYELQYAELATGGRLGGAAFTGPLYGGWRPWSSETLSLEP